MKRLFTLLVLGFSVLHSQTYPIRYPVLFNEGRSLTGSTITFDSSVSFLKSISGTSAAFSGAVSGYTFTIFGLSTDSSFKGRGLNLINGAKIGGNLSLAGHFSGNYLDSYSGSTITVDSMTNFTRKQVDSMLVDSAGFGINVKWYGAYGDYNDTLKTGHDDRAAIQAAIDSKPNRNSTVYFPYGHYKCGDSLILGEGTKLIGLTSYFPYQVYTGDTIRYRNQSALYFTGTGNGLVTTNEVVPYRCQNIRIENLGIFGTGKTNGKAGIIVRNNPNSTNVRQVSGNFSILYCFVSGWKIGFDGQNQADNSYIYRTQFDQCLVGIRGGVVDDKMDRCEIFAVDSIGVEITGNQAVLINTLFDGGTNQTSLYIHSSGALNIDMSENTFYQAYRAIRIDSASVIKILFNDFGGQSDTGIYITNSNNVSISHNTIENSTYNTPTHPLVYVYNSDKTQIYSNDFKGQPNYNSYGVTFNTSTNCQLGLENVYGTNVTGLYSQTGSSISTDILAENINFSETSWVLGSNAVSQSDNRRAIINGGGALSVTRGGRIELYGNQYASADSGKVILISGSENGVVRDIEFKPGGTLRGSFNGSSGNFTLNQDLTVSGDSLNATGALVRFGTLSGGAITTTANLTYTPTSFGIFSNAADASDINSITIGGGGAGTNTRGGFITLFGNQFASSDSGNILLSAGVDNGVNRSIKFQTNGNTRMLIDGPTANITFGSVAGTGSRNIFAATATVANLVSGKGQNAALYPWVIENFAGTNVAAGDTLGRGAFGKAAVAGSMFTVQRTTADLYGTLQNDSLGIKVFGTDSVGKILRLARDTTYGKYGVIAVLDTVERTASASIATTTFNGTKGTAGYFEVGGVVEVTAGSALGAVTVTLGFTNDNGAQTVTPISAFSAVATGQTYFSPVQIRNTSGSINWSTTVVSTPTYKVYLTCRRIY